MAARAAPPASLASVCQPPFSPPPPAILCGSLACLLFGSLALLVSSHFMEVHQPQAQQPAPPPPSSSLLSPPTSRFIVDSSPISSAFTEFVIAGRHDFTASGGGSDVPILTQLGEYITTPTTREFEAEEARRFLTATVATPAGSGGICDVAAATTQQMNADEDFIYAPAIKVDQENCCSSCEAPILDRVLLQANGRSWHEQCLRCINCASSLQNQPTCFAREGNIFCKGCYVRQFGTKCASCERVIHSTDWVRRARSLVFHLACFVCDQCKRQLSTGEEFALQESRLLCKQHFIELVEGDCTSTQKQKTKRVRTTFAEEQLQILQNHFRVDSNPDGADLERIANMTGLSKRVTQVWFQNSRARQKKYQGGGQKSDGDGNRSSQEPTSPTQKSEGSSDGVFSTSANSIPSSSEEAMAESTLVLSSLQYE